MSKHIPNPFIVFLKANLELWIRGWKGFFSSNFGLMENFAKGFKIFTKLNCSSAYSSQNRTGSGGRTVKTGNRDENQFFKHKEPSICGNSVNPKTGVGPHEPVARTMRVQPLSNFFCFVFVFFFNKKQLNTILFYLIKFSISYKE